MAAPPFLRHPAMALCLCGSLGFLHEHSWLWSSSLPSPQAVSSQSTAVPSSSLFSNPTFQYPAPVCTGRHLSQAGACRAVAWTIYVGLTLSYLPQTGCRALLRAPEAPLLSQLTSLLVRRASPDARTSPYLQFSNRGAGPVLLPLLFLFPSSFFCPTQLHGDLSCPFRCLRSSASVQQVLCENCSIRRCVLDAFVGRDELHILLLLCHLGKSVCGNRSFELIFIRVQLEKIGKTFLKSYI